MAMDIDRTIEYFRAFISNLPIDTDFWDADSSMLASICCLVSATFLGLWHHPIRGLGNLAVFPCDLVIVFSNIRQIRRIIFFLHLEI